MFINLQLEASLLTGIPGFTARTAVYEQPRNRILYSVRKRSMISPAYAPPPDILLEPDSGFGGGGVGRSGHYPGECWTETHCLGLVEICKGCCQSSEPPFDDSCGSWYPCGVCIGFWLSHPCAADTEFYVGIVLYLELFFRTLD
jgi:hypothetical protein